MKILIAAFTVSFLAALAFPEDYQCGDDAGCVARITEDGELQEVLFRKGDMVSTDAGWSVSTDDGWVKVLTRKPPRRACFDCHRPPFLPRPGECSRGYASLDLSLIGL